MIDIHDIAQVHFDGATLTADEMREFIASLDSHFINSKSTALRAEFLGVMSLRQCNDCLDTDKEAEAMRRGFRAAMYLAQFDFPMVQLALALVNQKKSTKSKLANLGERNADMRADYFALLETCERHEIARELQKLDEYKDLSLKRIRVLIKPFKP